MEALFRLQGPTIKVVILRTDGTVDERKVDMTPSLCPMEAVLGGPITLNGQYTHDLASGVVVVIRQNASTRSTHVLPPPFHRDLICGDICLVRMDANAMPVDFTQEEYDRLNQSFFVTRNSVRCV